MPSDGQRATRQLGLLEILFLLSALVAPLNLQVARAFTAYDMVTALIAVLILVGPRRISWSPSSLTLAALVLMAAGLLGAFRSTYPIQSVLQVAQLGFVFFVQIPVILTLARSRTLVRSALTMFITGYLIVMLVAVVAQNVQLAGRVVPFFNDNPNALAIPTIILVPFVLYFALDQWRKGRRLTIVLGGGTVLYLMLWALTASASRGSTAATVVSLSVFIVFRNGWERMRNVIVGLLVVAVAIAAVGSLVYWTSAFPDTLRRRVERSLSPEEGGQAVADERIALDHAGLKAFLSSPLIGTGFDNFRYVAQFYDDAATFHDPHNLWIQFLAQTGLLGAAAFLFIIVRWFLLLLRTQSAVRTRSERQLLWAFVAAMSGLMAHSMVAPLVLQRHYWLLYGLGIVAVVELAGGVEWSDATVPAALEDD